MRKSGMLLAAVGQAQRRAESRVAVVVCQTGHVRICRTNESWDRELAVVASCCGVCLCSCCCFRKVSKNVART